MQVRAGISGNRPEFRSTWTLRLLPTDLGTGAGGRAYRPVGTRCFNSSNQFRATWTFDPASPYVAQRPK